MKQNHGFYRLIMGIAILLASGCGGSERGNEGIIDASAPADTPPGGGDAAPAGDATPGGGDATPGGGDAAPGGVDAAPASDAGAVPPDASVGVVCGGEICDVGTECCATAGSTSCVETGTCSGVTVDCDGPEDCADGEVCCGSLGGAACAVQDSCQAVLCHTADDCPDPAQECCSLAGGDTSMCLNRCLGI